jgi:hypothetical protein
MLVPGEITVAWSSGLSHSSRRVLSSIEVTPVPLQDAWVASCVPVNLSRDLPSTRRLDLIPAPDELRTRCLAISLLEAALNTNMHTRWHLIRRGHGGEVTCRVDDGSGNQALYWFGTPGTVIRGFDHESPLTPWARDPMTLWPGLYDGLPTALAAAPTIENAGIESVSFCIWRTHHDTEWRVGSVALPPSVDADPDGSEFLMRPISSGAEAQRFLEEGSAARSVDGGCD